MANEMYPLSRQAFAAAGLNWVANDWRVALLDDTYVYDPTHDFYNDVAAAEIAVSANLTGKTNVLGVCDANDVTFLGVVAGDTVSSIVVYQWTGVASTSRVVIFYDTTAAAVMISVETNGGDVTVRWSNGSTKMFRV